MKEIIHVWEKKEVVLTSVNSYANPYMDVDVWVDLKGPGFEKRVYGFWDGGNIFKIRIIAAAQGEWSWVSGSNRFDTGLSGQYGTFTAIEWTEEEKGENPCRRGFIQAADNGHAFKYADGTAFYLLADTWWATPSFRFRWYDDEAERPIGPEMGFKDMVRYRKRQGYNGIAILAGHPTWANDGYPSILPMEDEYGTYIRKAWLENDMYGLTQEEITASPVKDMHNEGGRPFLFPGKVKGYEKVVPDFERINPEYFKYMDRKVDYLNEQGFIAFIEVSRRDVSQVWKRYGGWPETYTRYIHYIFSRYQANNTLLSPIHMDNVVYAIPSRDFNEPANLYIDKYGQPPFGNLLGTNAGPSTLANFGNQDEARWLTFHQLGNWRQHDHYWYLTEMYNSKPALPALNGEPYYPGFPDDRPEASSETADLYCRSGMYGSFLSGGLAGYIYGAEGMWNANIQPYNKYKMWDAIKFKSGSEVPHLMKFVMVQGARYQKLIPNSELVTPNKAGAHIGYTGWAYCAATEGKDWFMLYFEKDCPRVTVRGVIHDASYRLKWFNPRTGEWLDDAAYECVASDQRCRIDLPDFPTKEDWGASLVLVGQNR